eukprot:3283944-Pleurochrysis_carterae.AAC.1
MSRRHPLQPPLLRPLSSQSPLRRRLHLPPAVDSRVPHPLQAPLLTPTTLVLTASQRLEERPLLPPRKYPTAVARLHILNG